MSLLRHSSLSDCVPQAGMELGAERSYTKEESSVGALRLHAWTTENLAVLFRWTAENYLVASNQNKSIKFKNQIFLDF